MTDWSIDRSMLLKSNPTVYNHSIPDKHPNLDHEKAWSGCKWVGNFYKPGKNSPIELEKNWISNYKLQTVYTQFSFFNLQTSNVLPLVLNIYFLSTRDEFIHFCVAWSF